jgi:uncharacterized SAM-binding protein YcdF (DUF218 family)
MPPAKLGLRLLWWALAVALIAVSLLHWGQDLLIAEDPAPQHADAAIVLQGSIVAQKARIAGAMNLLQRGVVDRVLLSVPKESYWGQSIPPVARSYLERTYGSDLAARVDFCETSEDVDSTVQEEQAIRPCIQEHHWESIVVVTSDYHTRRTRLLWRRANRQEPKIRIWIEGVTAPEFQQPWWRHRQSAKIWLMETTKLVWTGLGGQ